MQRIRVVGIMINNIYNCDCMEFMAEMDNNSVDFTLTDIPYNEVHKKNNGLRKIRKDKRKASK